MGKNNGKLEVITHLVVSWLLYNLALAVVLLMALGSFKRPVLDIVITMAIFGVGFCFYQYDLWRISEERRAFKVKNGPVATTKKL